LRNYHLPDGYPPSQVRVHSRRNESQYGHTSGKLEAAIHSIRSEETIKHRVEYVLSCVHQKTQCLRKELTEKINETQVDLQAVKMPLDTQKSSLQETLADTRNDLYEELDLMFQVQARTTKAEIRINEERTEAKTEATRRDFQPQSKEVEARAKRGRGTGTSEGAAKPPKFDGTT
jgi:hypothetical protein